MSATLLMRMEAPLQSWGIQSNFTIRDTGREPSKSGVIGILCAALGRRRCEPLDDLDSLKMGVRVDREGRLSWDYQIAQDVLKSGGGLKLSEPSTRYYLADAVFLVGLEGELVWLEQLDEALHKPVWLIYLGRKAFPPSAPVWLKDGLRKTEELADSLTTYPWLVHPRREEQPEKLRLVLEEPFGEEVRPDVPLSFAGRQFGQRRVQTRYIQRPVQSLEELTCT